MVGLLGGSNVIEIIIRAKDEFSKVMKNAEESMGGLNEFVKKNALAIGAAGAAMVAAGVGAAYVLSDWAVKAAVAGDVQDSFNRVVGDKGVKVLEEFQKATLGTIDKYTIMGSVTGAVMRGISAETVPAIALYAQQLKDAGIVTGSVTSVIDSMSTAISTGRLQTLKSMGIMIEANDVYKAYAESIGAIVEQLTEEQKRGALVAAVLEEIGKKSAELPQPTADAADKIAQLNAKMTELKVSIGEGVAPVLIWFIDKIKVVVDWFDKLPGPVKIAIGVIAAVGAILLVLAGAIMVVTAATAAFTAVNIWWIAIILLAIAIIAGLIAIGVYLYKHWDELKEKVIKFGIGVQNVFIGIRNAVVTVWNYIIDFIAKQINRAISLINVLIRGINLIPGIDIGLIGKVTLEKYKGEMMEYKTFTPPTKETTTVINVTGDNYGVDAEQIGDAIMHNVQKTIRL